MTTTPPVTLPPKLHMAPATLPSGAELVLRVMPLPADVNANGDIFGGWIMAQVDLAGAVRGGGENKRRRHGAAETNHPS